MLNFKLSKNYFRLLLTFPGCIQSGHIDDTINDTRRCPMGLRRSHEIDNCLSGFWKLLFIVRDIQRSPQIRADIHTVDVSTYLHFISIASWYSCVSQLLYICYPMYYSIKFEKPSFLSPFTIFFLPAEWLSGYIYWKIDQKFMAKVIRSYNIREKFYCILHDD